MQIPHRSLALAMPRSRRPVGSSARAGSRKDRVAAFEREFGRPRAHPRSSRVQLHGGAGAVPACGGVRPGDDVATVSHSFIATANAVVAVGARPVFVDVQPHTYSMNPDALARAITPRTRAILCVHQIGFL